jgi:Zinc carboxypeptidase
VTYSTPGLQGDRTAFSSQSEIQSWLRDQVASASRSGSKAAVIPFGKSQRGEALEALVLTRASATDPAALLASGRPTVLLIAQQHGDEPAGSEALLVIARELAQGLLQPTLERINVVLVPRANPDGAAGNQRSTAGGLDLNRDHLLLSTPEAQALAALTRDYRPTLVVDAHEYSVSGPFLEKFGAVPKFDALLQYATNPDASEFLTKASEEWYRRPLLAALKGQGLTAEWYHTTSPDPADKQVSMGDAQPDSTRNVNGLKNAVSLMIQSRGTDLGRLHIQRRVHTHVTAINSVLQSTAQRVAGLNQLRPYIDKAVSAQACKGEAILQATPTDAQYDLAMLDPVSGADKVVSVDWDSALVLVNRKVRARPCGYWLAATATTAVERLQLHGVKVLRIAESGSLLGDSYRELSRKEGVRPEIRQTTQSTSPIVEAQVGLTRSVVDVARGSFYVPLNQPLANLVVAALEPDTPSSYFANRIVDGLQSTVRVMVEPSLKLEERP